MEKKIIRDIEDVNNVKISILQFLGSESAAIAINGLDAGKDISVKLNTIFHRFPDYKALDEKILTEQNKFYSEVSISERETLIKKIDDMVRLKTVLKNDILQLAKTLLSITVSSPRLEEAKRLFNEGRLKEASAVLAEDDLIKEQRDMLLMLDFLNKQQ